MTLLNDVWIRENAPVLFSDFDENRLQPASYDLILSGTVLVPGHGIVSIADPRGTEQDMARAELPFILSPGEFVLGSTRDIITVPDDVGARFEGKSTLGRMGLATHITAGFIDPGFHGAITVEIKNMTTATSIVLSRSMPIGQICFYEMNGPSRHPYGKDNGNHYNGQVGPKQPYFYNE